MTFVNDQNEVLETKGVIAITKQAVSFFNFKVKGDYSVNFTVENNSKNRAVLNYYGPQMKTQVAFTRQAFTLMRDGNEFLRGYIVIQEDNGDELNCYFISGNSNWVQSLTTLITEMDYTGEGSSVDYRKIITRSTITASRTATSGIVWPMVDWCYNGKKGSNYWAVAKLYDLALNDNTSFMEWMPCFYMSSLINEIAVQSGIKISGNLLNDPIFKSLIITPTTGVIKREFYKITRENGSSFTAFVAPATEYTYANFTEISDPESLLSSSTYYTANKYMMVRVGIEVVSSSALGVGNTITITTYSTSIGSYSVTSASGGGFTPSVFYYDILMSKNDVTYFTVSKSLGGAASITLNATFDVLNTVSINDVLDPRYFLPKIQASDIIKHLVGRFGCSVYYEEFSKTLNLNIIEKITDSYDWSQYYRSHVSEYTLEAAQNNYLRVASVSDLGIKRYNESHTTGFGEGNLQTGNTLKKENELFKLLFAPSQIDLDKNSSWLTNIPLVNLSDGDPIPYTSIATSGGLENYALSVAITLNVGEVVRIVDATRNDMGYFIVSSSGSGTCVILNTYSINSTGVLYRQNVTYNNTVSRELVYPVGLSIADIGVDSTYHLYNDSYADSSETSIGYGYFSKPVTNDTLDGLKSNLAFENPSISTYSDPTFKQLYFEKIGSFLKNPIIKAKMLLPEAIFQKFIFDRFIFLNTETLNGYFWVDSISNYEGSTKEVEVTLFML